MPAHSEPLDGGVFVYVDDGCTFGADSLLLADFARPAGWGSARERERVCDLGTGCGIIPLSWYARPRSPDAPPVEAVELSPDAAALASRSVTENGLAGRIRVHLVDWRSLPPSFEAGGFDRVVCNPPYFAPANGSPISLPACGRRASSRSACSGPITIQTPPRFCSSARRERTGIPVSRSCRPCSWRPGNRPALFD